MRPVVAARARSAPQPFLHQDAVVAVERHQVGHRAERDQVEQVRDGRLARAAPSLELARQRSHEVERDADAGQRAAAECRRCGRFGFTCAAQSGRLGPGRW